jgi:hypothetical protein
MEAIMARKKKAGARHACGKLRQPLTPEKLAKDAETQAQTMATVLAQPHRRGSTDQRCESALGRFVLAQWLRSEVYDAGLSYAAGGPRAAFLSICGLASAAMGMARQHLRYAGGRMKSRRSSIKWSRRLPAGSFPCKRWSWMNGISPQPNGQRQELLW